MQWYLLSLCKEAKRWPRVCYRAGYLLNFVANTGAQCTEVTSLEKTFVASSLHEHNRADNRAMLDHDLIKSSS